MKKKLYTFLKKKDILLEYLINQSTVSKLNKSKWYYKINLKFDPKNAITNAFLWHKSTEGHNFWNNIDKDWRLNFNN